MVLGQIGGPNYPILGVSGTTWNHTINLLDICNGPIASMVITLWVPSKHANLSPMEITQE